MVLGLVDVSVANATVRNLHHHNFRPCIPVVTTWKNVNTNKLISSYKKMFSHSKTYPNVLLFTDSSCLVNHKCTQVCGYALKKRGGIFITDVPMNRISEPIEIEPCSSGEKSMYILRNVFLSLKNSEKIICMYTMETPVGMRNLKLKYIYLWPVQKRQKNTYSARSKLHSFVT
jgi:hypothetical protein